MHFGSDGSQLEDGSLCGELFVRILNIRAQANNRSVKEVIGLTGTMRAIVLIMFVQLHPEVTVQPCLRQASGKCFIRIEHLLHTGESIHVHHFCAELVVG